MSVPGEFELWWWRVINLSVTYIDSFLRIPDDVHGSYKLYSAAVRTDAEHFSGGSQRFPNLHCERVRVTKHAPHDPFRVLECFHGLAEIVESGARVLAHTRSQWTLRAPCDTRKPRSAPAIRRRRARQNEP